MNSSKKRTNEFDFTTMIPQVDLFSFVFWKKLKTPKRHFEINWPLNINSPGSPRPGRPCPLARAYSCAFWKMIKDQKNRKIYLTPNILTKIIHSESWLLSDWSFAPKKKSEKLAHLRLLFRKPYRWELRVWCERHAILMQHNWANFFLKNAIK